MLYLCPIVFSASTGSQDVLERVPSAFLSTYNKEYSGSFGPPAPNARYCTARLRA